MTERKEERERQRERGRGKACMYIYEVVGMKKGMEGGEKGRR